MPLSRVSKVFAVKDGKMRKITADPDNGVKVVAASVDVPGIKSVTITGTVDTKVLRGDNMKLDQMSVLTDVVVTFTYAKLSLDVLGVVLGGATVDAGTTPNQTSAWSLTGDNVVFSYFEFEAQAVAGDSIGGDVVLKLEKCVLSSFPEGIGMAEEDYTGPFSVEAGAQPTLATGKKWLSVTFRETAAALV